MANVLTTHRLAYLCCQCDASLGVKQALVLAQDKEQFNEMLLYLTEL